MFPIHEDTKREIIEGGTGLASSLLKEIMVHRNQVEVLEKEKEKEVEVAKARAKHQSGRPQQQQPEENSPAPATTHDTLERVDGQMQATPNEIEDALDDLIDEEMCSVCRDLLVALKDRPTHEQVRGIMEYGTFKQNLDDGAGVDQLKSLIRETDVLQSVFQEKYTGMGNQA